MAKVNLKDNIWVKGLNNEIYFPHIFDVCSKDADNIVYKAKNIIYSGRTSEMPEDVAVECVFQSKIGRFKDYSHIDKNLDEVGLFNALLEFKFKTAKESIKSACPEEYCVIYKTIE